MTDESCTCGCATKPADEANDTNDDCTCGCGGARTESKDGAIA